jgi:hypothetical protein
VSVSGEKLPPGRRRHGFLPFFGRGG